MIQDNHLINFSSISFTISSSSHFHLIYHLNHHLIIISTIHLFLCVTLEPFHLQHWIKSIKRRERNDKMMREDEMVDGMRDNKVFHNYLFPFSIFLSKIFPKSQKSQISQFKKSNFGSFSFI